MSSLYEVIKSISNEERMDIYQHLSNQEREKLRNFWKIIDGSRPNPKEPYYVDDKTNAFINLSMIKFIRQETTKNEMISLIESFSIVSEESLVWKAFKF